MTVIGYLWGSNEDLWQQQAAVVQYAAAKGLAIGGYFTDCSGDGGPLTQRPEGRRLAMRLESGDVAVFPALDVFEGFTDLSQTLGWFSRRQITSCLADLDLDTSTPDGRRALELLGHFAAWQKRRRSRQSRATMARLKAAGLPTNRWPTEGYGFRRRGRNTIEVFEEQWVILQIDNLRSERPPQSYWQIYCLLQLVRWCERCGAPILPDSRRHPRKVCPDCSEKVRPLRTRTGSSWSKARVERICRRARATQQQERVTAAKEQE
jgi:DNA invertase Pin-like site-specific DNA recombinase